MKFIKDLTTSLKAIYKVISPSGLILIFIVILLSILMTFKMDGMGGMGGMGREGYQQDDRFLFKRGSDVYDGFYSEIYDFLVYNDTKDEYEIGAILNRTNPTTKSVILDVGSGTGHHVGLLGKRGLNVVGIDISPSMVAKAKENYPQYRFIVGDVLNSGQFPYGTFTHILCLYFTIYYFQNKAVFFRNCMDWLMPGGFLIIHLVDRDNFDPILPAGNPLYIVSPQRYAKQRITHSKVTFDKFKYEGNFTQNPDSPNISTFEEKIVFNDGRARRQEHRFFMEPHQDILVMAQQAGFLLQGQIDMIKCAYDHQYLYILTKPTN